MHSSHCQNMQTLESLPGPGWPAPNSSGLSQVTSCGWKSSPNVGSPVCMTTSQGAAGTGGHTVCRGREPPGHAPAEAPFHCGPHGRLALEAGEALRAVSLTGAQRGRGAGARSSGPLRAQCLVTPDHASGARRRSTHVLRNNLDARAERGRLQERPGVSSEQTPPAHTLTQNLPSDHTGSISMPKDEKLAGRVHDLWSDSCNSGLKKTLMLPLRKQFSYLISHLQLRTAGPKKERRKGERRPDTHEGSTPVNRRRGAADGAARDARERATVSPERESPAEHVKAAGTAGPGSPPEGALLPRAGQPLQGSPLLEVLPRAPHPSGWGHLAGLAQPLITRRLPKTIDPQRRGDR